MTINTVNAFFLGVFADFDIEPGEPGAQMPMTLSENADLLTTAGPNGDGVFGSATDPFYNAVGEITLNSGSDEIVSDDEFVLAQPDDSLTFGGVASRLDSMQEYNITVTYKDGTTATGIGAVVQDELGRAFLIPFAGGATGNPNNDILKAGPIESIDFTSVSNANFFGISVALEDITFPCFATGARILTERGEVAVEDLSIGDRVLTRDNGAQPIRWIGSRTVPASGTMTPMVIGAGLLGATRDLVVSPQHRVLVTGWMAEAMFGAPEVLVAAKHLCAHDRVRARPGGAVTYHHLLFDRHEVITANGVATESFHPGDMSLGAVGDATRDEILALFPELGGDVAAYGAAARPCARAFEGRVLATAL